ncbi:MAG TPA: SDR family NAD(P)-dependent oxidoreductase [Candidatus Binatia bacterium]|jgi:NAD(P)-dependent dehydrogenase (short-subunit alcohol dehydrogenase family)|nr:SDR family NAD(P)-dependent oxidoreductase [Candidatus Binatia bacterium]
MADSKTKRLAGKVAIITGSGRGIGRCEVLLMAQQGAKVVVSDIGTDGEGTRTAEKVAGEIRAVGGEAVAVTENVATLEGARRTVEAALQSYGRLDIVVNNAGLRAGNPIDKLTEEQWNLVVDSHLKASFAMMKFAVPVLKRQGGGVIINTGSEAGLGMIFNSAYAAAKEGIAGLTRSVAREQGRFGIRCNMIRPRATVNTGGGAWGKEVFARWTPMVRALGRYWIGDRGLSGFNRAAHPEQVAELVVWLCTDAAANVNGRSFYVAGEEVGLWSEPELIRSLTRPGGWDLDALDAFARDAMTADLTNPFLIDDPLQGKE